MTQTMAMPEFARLVSHHHRLGVVRTYVFRDERCPEGAPALSGEGVTNLHPPWPRMELLRTLAFTINSERYAQDVAIRKLVNLEKAVALAAVDGLDWLIALDETDVLIVSGPSLAETFGEVPADAEQVELRALEAVPANLDEEDVFAHPMFFKDASPQVAAEPGADGGAPRLWTFLGGGAVPGAVRPLPWLVPESLTRFGRRNGELVPATPIDGGLRVLSYLPCRFEWVASHLGGRGLDSRAIAGAEIAETAFEADLRRCWREQGAAAAAASYAKRALLPAAAAELAARGVLIRRSAPLAALGARARTPDDAEGEA